MSSNRSISGARQRRAGEPSPAVGPRSNTSIGSQQIFAKQQINQQQFQHKQQVQQQLPRTIPKGVGAAPSPLPQSQDPNDPQQMSKLTIPKAFTLVTLRLGRIEQFIQQLQEEGGLPLMDKNNENGADDVFLKNILSRIENLEKTNKVPSVTTDSKSLEELKQSFVKLDKDLRETKDLLLMMMMKYEKFTLETNDKIENVHNVITELKESRNEKEEFSIYDEEHGTHEMYEETDEEEEENENISAVNLKEFIENELASEN